jgi:NADH-quinone oxidoreductase subunit J
MGVNFHSVFFYLMAVLASGFALAVVFSNNIVRMAFYLVASLGAVAGLFFLAGADFVAALQLMIYVGGTLVLLIFGVMLTARGPFADLKTSPAQWTVVGLVGGSLLAVLLYAASSASRWTGPGKAASAPPDQVAPTSAPLGLALLGPRVDKLDPKQNSSSRAGGMAGYLLPFEIVSVHLVVVLIGAAYLARARRRAMPRPIAAKSPPDDPSQPPSVS